MFEGLMKSKGWPIDWEFDWIVKKEAQKRAENAKFNGLAKAHLVATATTTVTPAKATAVQSVDSRRRSSSINRTMNNSSFKVKPSTPHVHKSSHNNLNHIK
jgi:hypothetical protein